MKRRLLIISLELFLLVTIVIGYYMKQNYYEKLTFNKIQIDSNAKNSYYGMGIATLIRADNHNFYGEIGIFETGALFQYNIDNNKLILYRYNGKNKIIDFIITSKYIYFIQLSLKDDGIKWQLNRTDLKFNDVYTYKEGYVKNPSEYPKLLADDNNIAVVSLSEKDDIRSYSIDLIKGKTLENIIAGNGHVTENKGSFLYNISSIYMDKEGIYYTLIDKENVQKLYKFDINKKQSELIYTNKDYENTIINSYKKIKNDYLIQLSSKMHFDKAYYILISNNNFIKLNDHNFRTSDTLIGDNILFHNSKDKFEIYDSKKRRFIKLKTNLKKGFYPNYLIVGNKIVIKDSNDNFYIANLLKN